MNKRSFFIIFLGFVLGLLFFLGRISGFFIPIQEKLFAIRLKSPAASVFLEDSCAAKIKALEEENTQLKKLTALISKNSFYITAQVLGHEIKSPTLLVLNRGRADGVEEGMAVLSEEGFFAGKIIEAKEQISVALFPTDQKSKISAVILDNQSTLSGLIKGAHSLGLSLSLIPKEEPIKVGDIVLTAGEEIGIPRGIPVAKVEKISETYDGLLKEAVLMPLADPKKLLFVAITSEKGL